MLAERKTSATSVNSGLHSVLEQHGIHNVNGAYWNLTSAQLLEHAIQRREGLLAADGAFVVRTGQFTGRSPKDKYIVRDEITDSTVQWGPVNQPMSERISIAFIRKCAPSGRARTSSSRIAWWAPTRSTRCRVRVVSAVRLARPFRAAALHPSRGRSGRARVRASARFHHSVRARIPGRSRRGRHEFRKPASSSISRQRVVLICGTSYAGEMKKSVFTILNYLLPDRGVLPMHCSANVGTAGDVALFFGLSGHRQDYALGRPAPPADRRRRARLERPRRLQFRGRLLCQVHPALAGERTADLERHPLRHRAGKRRAWTPKPAQLDFDSDELTENTRAAYPLEFIENAVMPERRRPPAQRHLPDRRCFRRAAADFAPHARTGHVPLPERLHRQGRGHRARSGQASRRPPSAPASARRSCRVRPQYTPPCSARNCAATARAAGW